MVEGEQEVAPGEEEAEQGGGDERVAAQRQHDREEGAQAPGTVDPGRLQQRHGDGPHEGLDDEDGEGDAQGGVGEDEPQGRVEHPQVVVGAVQPL